jgi:hypothetical protein
VRGSRRRSPGIRWCGWRTSRHSARTPTRSPSAISAQAYQIVDRQGIRVLRDPFTSKPFIKFYTTKRTGGGMVNFEAIKLMKFI